MDVAMINLHNCSEYFEMIASQPSYTFCTHEKFWCLAFLEEIRDSRARWFTYLLGLGVFSRWPCLALQKKLCTKLEVSFLLGSFSCGLHSTC